MFNMWCRQRQHSKGSGYCWCCHIEDINIKKVPHIERVYAACAQIAKQNMLNWQSRHAFKCSKIHEIMRISAACTRILALEILLYNNPNISFAEPHKRLILNKFMEATIQTKWTYWKLGIGMLTMAIGIQAALAMIWAFQQAPQIAPNFDKTRGIIKA